MDIDPATYWSQTTRDGTIERWSRNARRKIFLWRCTVVLARGLKRALDLSGALAALCGGASFRSRCDGNIQLCVDNGVADLLQSLLSATTHTAPAPTCSSTTSTISSYSRSNSSVSSDTPSDDCGRCHRTGLVADALTLYWHLVRCVSVLDVLLPLLDAVVAMMCRYSDVTTVVTPGVNALCSVCRHKPCAASVAAHTDASWLLHLESKRSRRSATEAPRVIPLAPLLQPPVRRCCGAVERTVCVNWSPVAGLRTLAPQHMLRKGIEHIRCQP